MKKRTREKVALLVFALLVVLGGSVLLRYFETGRSFNMAATAVDDAFGQMSGYTAIVFDGTYDVLDALRPTKLPSVDGDADYYANARDLAIRSSASVTSAALIRSRSSSE